MYLTKEVVGVGRLLSVNGRDLAPIGLRRKVDEVVGWPVWDAINGELDASVLWVVQARLHADLYDPSLM